MAAHLDNQLAAENSQGYTVARRFAGCIHYACHRWPRGWLRRGPIVRLQASIFARGARRSDFLRNLGVPHNHTAAQGTSVIRTYLTQALLLRRALRILPAFYGYVCCVIVLETLGLFSLPQHNLIYVLTYTVNFALNGTWWTGHLWSLSVEEQFYMLWPLAICFFHVRTCAGIALLAVFAGVLIRLTFAITGVQLINPRLSYAFPFVSGAIGMGCLLAIGELWAKRAILSIRRFSGWITLVAVSVVMLLDTLDLGSLNRPIRIADDLALTYLVGSFVYLPASYLGSLLNLRTLAVLGNLSYSIYLWQQLFFHHWANWWVCRFPFNLLATVGAACASYFLLEKPFLRLRRRFRPESINTPEPRPTPLCADLVALPNQP